MGRLWLARVLVSASMIASVPGVPTLADSDPTIRATDESYFIDRVYPVLYALQCERCHSDNGVASETRVQFPEAGAGRDRIAAFGLSLIDLVDRGDPEHSLLLRKPTRRVRHAGGQRIKPGSDEEEALRGWVDYLAGFSDKQVRLARERIARSERRSLEPLTVRRLTHSQYNHTVRDLLGDQSQPAYAFPMEDFINGFKNQVEGLGVSPLQAEAYSRAAERLALAAFRGGDQRRLIPLAAQLAEGRGRRGGVRAAVRLPGVPAPPGRGGGAPLHRPVPGGGRSRRGTSTPGPRWSSRPCSSRRTSSSGSSRGRIAPMPSSRSPAGSRTSSGTRCPTTTSCASPDGASWRRPSRSRPRRVGCSTTPAPGRHWTNSSPSGCASTACWRRRADRRRYREFNGELAAAMVEETRRLFNHLVWGNRDFREFFTAGYTFANADLARLYGLPEPAEDFAKIDYPPDSGRSGVLGHGSFLVLTSKPAETSPTARGLFIRNKFLAHEIPPPPAGVNTVLPEVTEDAPMTNRQRLDIHLNSESCAGCHRLIDPIGLGFEQYDAIGVFREKLVLQFAGPRGDSWARTKSEHQGAGGRYFRARRGVGGFGLLDAPRAGPTARREQDLPSGHREAVVPLRVRPAGDAGRPAGPRRAGREVPRLRLPIPRIDRRAGHVGPLPPEGLGLTHGHKKSNVPPPVPPWRGPVGGRDPGRPAGLRGDVQRQRHGLRGRGGRRGASRSRPGSSSGSTATGSSRNTGSRATTARIMR